MWIFTRAPGASGAFAPISMKCLLPGVKSTLAPGAMVSGPSARMRSTPFSSTLAMQRYIRELRALCADHDKRRVTRIAQPGVAGQHGRAGRCGAYPGILDHKLSRGRGRRGSSNAQQQRHGA